MSAITTSYHANVVGTGNRAANNPAGSLPYSEKVPGNLMRAHLFIQNKGQSEVELTIAASGSTIRLFGGSSISIDNYNGGFSLNSYANASILEAFA